MLTNGRVIDAERAWYEGTQVRYEKSGGTFGLPRDLVARVEQGGPSGSLDPDLARARDRLSANDPTEAVKLLQAALARDPRSLAALHAMAEAQLALGDRVAAELEYRESLRLHADPEVQRKLGEVAPAPSRAEGGAQFRLRYDGGIDQPLGTAVLETLGAAYNEFARRLGFRPQDPITVVLQTEAAFQDARTPEWAVGVNDGAIRVPVRGLEGKTVSPQQVPVLRHELAHSFIAARTGGNCPTWLQEGVSQWLEGGDPTREDATLAEAARRGGVHPLITLEAPFQTLPPADVSRAYAESLSAVAHILRRRGDAGVVRLLAALGDGLPSEEALPVALALSYPELQKSWEDYLRMLTARR